MHSVQGGLVRASEGSSVIEFTLSDEHRELQAIVAAFAETKIKPAIGDYYERRAFPYEIIGEMAKMGLFGLPFPEQFGGMGGAFMALCLAVEELARIDSSVAITLEAAVCLGAMPVFRFGTEEQKHEWLPMLCSGQSLAAFGLTEAGGGTDVAGGMKSTAELQDEHWVINGSK